MDTKRRRVQRNGRTLDVGGLTYDLLVELIQHPNATLSINDLVQSVWNNDPVSNEVITQRVRMLRRALDDDPANPSYIETVRGKGYRICRDNYVPEARGASAYWWLGLGLALIAVAVFFSVNHSKPKSQHAELLERAHFYGALGPSDDNLRAISLYEQVLSEDPDNKEARLSLSFEYANRVCRHDGGLDYVDKAKALANDLLAEFPNNAEATAALAYSDDCLGYLDAALSGYLKAYELDNTRYASLASAAHLLQVKGRVAEALAANLIVQENVKAASFRYLDMQIARCLELLDFDAAAEKSYQRTVSLYPDNLFAAKAYAQFLMGRGRVDEALDVAQRAQSIGGDSASLSVLLAELALLTSRNNDAVAWLENASGKEDPGSWPVVLLGLQHGKGGDKDWLKQWVERVNGAIADGDVWPDNWLVLTLLYWELREPDQAMESLRQAMTAGFRDRNYLQVSPFFAEIRNHPGFDGLLEEMRQALSHERDQAMTASWWHNDIIATGL